jgi:hypothetical protein
VSCFKKEQASGLALFSHGQNFGEFPSARLPFHPDIFAHCPQNRPGEFQAMVDEIRELEDLTL